MMSTTQEQIISHVVNMSEIDAKFILEIIERLIPKEKILINSTISDKINAFQRLKQLRGGFPADFDPDKELAEAREATEFKDLEDCLQDKCAITVKADYIVTRNVTDYKFADTKVITPSEFCKLIEK